MSETALGLRAVTAAILRAAAALEANRDYLTELDQVLGDGDLGITAGKIATALKNFVEAIGNGDELVGAQTQGSASETSNAGKEKDIGQSIGQLGMEINRAASSSFGTLLATGVMRAGREARGLKELAAPDLARMLSAADEGIRERGKASPGDKTVVDVLHPAAKAFEEAVRQDSDLPKAFEVALAAGKKGLDSVTPLRSRIGRSSWIGERTEGKVDPGAAAGLIILMAIGGQNS